MGIQRSRKGRSAYSMSTVLTVGNINEKLVLQCELDEGTMYTIQFTVKTPDSIIDLSGSGSSFQVLAILEWSVEGNTMRRIISVANGTSVTGAGKNVTIRVFDFSLLNVATTVQYLVSVNVAKTVRPSSQVQPLLAADTVRVLNGITQPAAPPYPGLIRLGNDFIRAVSSGAEMILDVPQDAGINAFYPIAANSIDSHTLTGFEFTIVARDIVEVPTITWDASSLNKWIPIPPALRTLNIRNDYSEVLQCGVIFGVDG